MLFQVAIFAQLHDHVDAFRVFEDFEELYDARMVQQLRHSDLFSPHVHYSTIASKLTLN